MNFFLMRVERNKETNSRGWCGQYIFEGDKRTKRIQLPPTIFFFFRFVSRVKKRKVPTNFRALRDAFIVHHTRGYKLPRGSYIIPSLQFQCKNNLENQCHYCLFPISSFIFSAEFVYLLFFCGFLILSLLLYKNCTQPVKQGLIDYVSKLRYRKCKCLRVVL